MAKHVITRVIDDIDGSEDAQTVSFAFDGKSYEIDLSAENKQKLADALAPFIAAGRTTSSRSSAPAKGGRKDLAAIREWAAANGYEVSARGRIAANIVQAYDNAK